MAKSKVIPVRFSAIELAWITHGQKVLNYDTRSDLIRDAWKKYLKENGVPVESVPELYKSKEKKQ